jgi:Protein of unknown function (DUF2961)
MATDRRILGACLAAGVSCAAACTPAPASPTGWDAYRRLDQLPLYRAGETARLASSYDRWGGNADGGRFACRRVSGGRCVIAEHTGPGEIDSIWSTRPRAGDVRRTGTIRIELDGRNVLDASLADVAAGRLGAPFAFPAVASARQASGAVWIKVPMAFRERMRITTSRNPGYVRVNYRTFESADGVTTFDPDDPAPDALRALRREPDDLALPTGIVSDLERGGVIEELLIDVGARPTAAVLRETRVHMTFDGKRTVDSPLGELFGSGLPARVRSLMASHRDGVFRMSWPMPFQHFASIDVAGPVPAGVRVRANRSTEHPAYGGPYFHATSRHGRTVRGRPWKVLEVDGRGLLVGLSATLEGPRSQRHLEGDETIVADGVALRGTGTEDFFEGGFYWFHGTRSLPLVGSPAHLVRRGGCAADCRSMYRWLVADAVPFQRSLRFTLEHGDRNRVAGRYSTTALWYGP